MFHELQLLSGELERDIVVLQQMSVLKCGQLEETRKKLYKEIAENQIVRNSLDKKLDELQVTKKELELNVKANEILQEEYRKCRDNIAKLQTENEFFKKERELIIDKSHANDVEISNLRTQIEDLEEKLQEYVVYKEFNEKAELKNKNLIDQIQSKLDMLTKDQNRLENFVKDTLEFTNKISEERNLQSLFLKEANISRVILENEMLRLIGVLEEERVMKRILIESSTEKEPRKSYLDDWKSSQQEMSEKIRFLMEENKRLLNEVEELKTQLDKQMEKNL